MTETSTDQVQQLKAAREAEDKTAEDAPDSATYQVSLQESLSAMVDGEASEIEVRRLLKAAETDPEIRAQWKRYQLVCAALKGEVHVDPQVDVSARISAAIAEEKPLRSQGRLRQWTEGVGKVAIAASVTVAFIFGVQQFGVEGQAPVEVAESASNSVEPAQVADSVPSGFELPPFAARAVSTSTDERQGATSAQLVNRYQQGVNGASLQDNQALQNHFNQLLLKHAEKSSSSGNMGLIPFARVSTTDAAE